MSQHSDPASLLSDILEGRPAGAGPAFAEAQALARLSARCRGLAPAGPSGAARARMESRFAAYIDGRGRRSYVWLPPLPRTGMQRFAAGAVLMVGLGSGAAVANPAAFFDLASAAVDLVRNVAVNLVPADSAGGDGPAPSTPQPTTAQTATETAKEFS